MYTHFEALIESYLINEKHMRPRFAGDKVVIQATPEIESGEQVWVVSTYGEMGRNKQVVVSVADILLFIANGSGSGSGTYSLRDDLAPIDFAPAGYSSAVDELRQYKDALSNIRTYKDLLALDKLILKKLIEVERFEDDGYGSFDSYSSGGHHRDKHDIYKQALDGVELPDSGNLFVDESGILRIDFLDYFEDGHGSGFHEIEESEVDSPSPSPFP